MDCIFTRFLPPTISLLSSPLALAVGAGVRSALVVDLGWSETVVTSLYEYRERPPNDKQEHALSFEECSDITTRMLWCKPRQAPTPSRPTSEALPTVQEQDEGESEEHPTSRKTATVTVPLRSCTSPISLDLPFDALSEPCENTFFDTQYSPTSFDDHELPLHLLVYRALLHLPVDVRALCMSRIIFTGGCSNVLGLRGRIFDEVSHLIQTRGWDSVYGKGVDQLRVNPKLKRNGTHPTSDNQPNPTPQQPSDNNTQQQEQDAIWHDAANTTPLPDPIEEQLKRGTDRRPRIQGEMRAVESVGAWSGASLITHLKAPAIAMVEREAWLQQGAAGASKVGMWI
ncbi:hypothetical protein N0V88_000018 [Collariella sp. IMI 366227]|nr:hypothetical protein N0V88_000018 [Collariella sp. IMI 366227]